MGPSHTEAAVAQILNDAWLVRHYARGGRTVLQKDERRRAIQVLGLHVRSAFDESNDFEPLLAAIVDGLRPKDNQPF